MGKTFKPGDRQDPLKRASRAYVGPRKLRVRSARHHSPDLRKLARAMIDLAAAQSEADAASNGLPTTGPKDSNDAGLSDPLKPTEDQR